MGKDFIAPVAAAQRVELLDSLRGFALAGVLYANLTAFSLYMFLPDAAVAALPTLATDRWLLPAYQTFVSGEFFTLFSLLFGIGFALQMQRSGDSIDGLRRYRRRLAILLLIGLLHSWLWWGDILRYYAVAGLLLIPMRHVPARTLAIAGVVLAIVPHALIPAFRDGPAALLDTREAAFAVTLAAFSDHGWATMLRGNLAFNHWWVLSQWQHACWAAGCLLIGSALGRQGVITEPQHHRLFWKRLLRWALPAGLLACAGLTLESYGRLPMVSAWLEATQGSVLQEPFAACARLALGLGYMAAFVTLFRAPGMHRWLRPLAPVGRMALSNYLAQSLIGIALFYGVGLGIGPRHGMVGVTVAWLPLFAAQIACSRWWLARYRFGPAEWLWRSLTYRRRQPMRVTRTRDDTRASHARRHMNESGSIPVDPHRASRRSAGTTN